MFKTLGVSVISLLLMSGCITETEKEMMMAASQDSSQCQSKIVDARVQIAKFKAQGAQNQPVVMFKNETNALTYLMVKQMGDMNMAMVQAITSGGDDGIGACDDVIVAMVKAEAQQTVGYQAMGRTALNWTMGLIGLGIISDNWGPGAYEGSSSTQTNINSRVVSDSVNNGGSISSSGTGLGVGNTSGGGDAVGGFYPRSQMDLVNDNAGSQSNSGELNAVVPVLPVEVAPE